MFHGAFFPVPSKGGQCIYESILSGLKMNRPADRPTGRLEEEKNVSELINPSYDQESERKRKIGRHVNKKPSFPDRQKWTEPRDRSTAKREPPKHPPPHPSAQPQDVPW